MIWHIRTANNVFISCDLVRLRHKHYFAKLRHKHYLVVFRNKITGLGLGKDDTLS